MNQFLLPGLFLMLLLSSCRLFSKQADISDKHHSSVTEYRVMFWNVENLFDIYDDTLTNDDEFTPNGLRAWNYTKYRNKINNIYKVFIAAGNPDPPEIIALCEVENRRVLNDLAINSPFGKYDYSILHKDSQDARGIDVAVLFNPGRVRLLQSDFITPILNSTKSRTTRDIVLMEAEINRTDTVFFLFCHWPSKYGGAGLTEPLRNDIAGCLRKLADSIQMRNEAAKIVVGGDLNDPPVSGSIRTVLNARCPEASENINTKQFYNLCCHLIPGTHKYQGIWETLDQFIVTGSMMRNSKNEWKSRVVVEVFSPDFLLETDDKHTGFKPFRTWEGMRYKGGYSDHLPVILSVCQ